MTNLSSFFIILKPSKKWHKYPTTGNHKSMDIDTVLLLGLRIVLHHPNYQHINFI